MSENKNIKTKTEEKEGKKFLSEKNLALVITAAILVVVIIATAVVLVVDYIKSDKGFDYTTSDLSKYFEFTDDYKNFTVNVDIAKPKDIDVDVAVIGLLCANKDKSSAQNIKEGYSWEIGVGDVVNIWYRGYILDENGEKIERDGMCNFSGTAPSGLEIGSGGFVPGFEYNLIGKMTGDAKKFEKIISGAPKEGQILYVSFTRTTEGVENSTLTKKTFRIDPSDENLDEIYGEKFTEHLMLGAFGSKRDFTTETSDGKKYNYKDFTVNFATTCEDQPIIVECYFPYDYSEKTLRNETAYFEVYVDSMIDYTVPEFNDEFIKKQIEDNKLGVTLEKLNEYAGDDLKAKYYAYASERLQESYEEEYDTLLKEAIIEHYRTISKGLKYPGVKVDELFDEYYDKVNDSYITNGGKIANSYGSTTTYDTLDKYAVAYLGLKTGDDWQAYIRGISEDAIKERYMMYYVLRTENLMPTKDELKNKIEEVKTEMVEEYTDQYLEYEGKTRDDYTDAEYEAFLEERRDEVLSYYDEEYFEESAYFEIFMDAVTSWSGIKVSTLDDRRAFPVSVDK